MTNECKTLLQLATKLVVQVNASEPDVTLDSVLEFHADHLEIRGRYPRPDSHKIALPADVQNQASSALYRLALNGYIVIIGGDGSSLFSLTQKGLHPNRIKWNDFKAFLLKSVLVPIVVSVITTIATLVINGVLSH